MQYYKNTLSKIATSLKPQHLCIPQHRDSYLEIAVFSFLEERKKYIYTNKQKKCCLRNWRLNLCAFASCDLLLCSQHARLACMGQAAASSACARMEGNATASLGSACAPAGGPGRPVSWVSTSGGPCGYEGVGEQCNISVFV